MYPKFIELHDIDNGSPFSINIDHLVEFFGDEEYALVRLTNEKWHCRETYDEVKALITDAGCLIKKADPRLDMTHPLTMDDLREMIGQPVWNSNSNEWMLVVYVEDDLFVQLRWKSGNSSEYYEDDLIKYPFYRMKVVNDGQISN